MLIKSILYVPGDFQKTLRCRRMAALGLLGVGLVGIACSLLLHSTLQDFARGFYHGAAAGITLGAMILLLRVEYLLHHPEKQTAARIREQDEREVAIKDRAFRLAGLIVFFVDAAALFVVLPLSFSAFFALLAVMALYSLCFLFACVYYTKKL